MVLSHNYCCGSCLIFFRKLYIYSVLRTNHYKVLGLTPSATQSEIKSAYYELSKKHHPDRNQGSEKSAKMFRNITAAYEVLGNEKLRKKYDETQRLNVGYDSSSFETPPRGDYNDDIEKMYYERRQRRFHRRYYYGKTPYYDFDAWYKAHYGKNPFAEQETWWWGPNKKTSSDPLNKDQDRERNEYRFKTEMYRTYTFRQSQNAAKKVDSFIFKTENLLMLLFYSVIIMSVISRM